MPTSLIHCGVSSAKGTDTTEWPVSESLPVPNVAQQVMRMWTVDKYLTVFIVMEIQPSKVIRGISFPEARIIEQKGNTPTSAKSYSDVAGANKCSVACETKMTWPLGAQKLSKVQKLISQAVSTMTANNTAQSTVTPATKIRPQKKRGYPHHIRQ